MATPGPKNASDLSEQAIALAEQLGRMAGTIEGTAEAWLSRRSLTDQLTRVRDGAAEMLESLTTGALQKKKKKKKTVSRTTAARARHADAAHAPRKQHRKPAPTLRG